MAYKHFYKMYIYIYISDIFVAVYALNARGSGRNIWGLYAAVNSPNPGSVFQRSPIPDVEKFCRSLSLLVSVVSLFMLRSPLFQQNTSKSSSDRTHLHFLFPLFSPEQFYARYLIIFDKQMLLDSNACISEWFFPLLFTCCNTYSHELPFFFLSEGSHDVITIWHKVQNCISWFVCLFYLIFFFFGMGFFSCCIRGLTFTGCFFPLCYSTSMGCCETEKKQKKRQVKFTIKLYLHILTGEA